MGEKTVEKSFLYLLPEKHMAEELAQVLTDTGFDKKKSGNLERNQSFGAYFGKRFGICGRF